MDSSTKTTPKKIGIIGAGFAGVSVAAMLNQLSAEPVEVILFEKTGDFGTGDAYRTPYPFHLLNVRAIDMSALEAHPQDFVQWLATHPPAAAALDKALPIGEQFVPRSLYGDYLKSLLTRIHTTNSNVRLIQEQAEVIAVQPTAQGVSLCLHDQREMMVDKVVLATGNYPAPTFPFPVADDVHAISHPWDYAAIQHVPKHASVMMIGTGLSMIDAVLSLHHQQHQGTLYAVSRHGLLPLPHADVKVPFILLDDDLPHALRPLMRLLREKSQQHSKNSGDWRSVVNALRHHVPKVWARTALADRKRFLRHLLPYWNIHRHRVNNKVFDLLTSMIATKQLTILRGRVQAVVNQRADIKHRHAPTVTRIPVDCLINCMGPGLELQPKASALMQSLLQHGLAQLDPLKLGLIVSQQCALVDASGKASSRFYTLGAPARASFWECSAVPEIRKQSAELAKALLQ